MLEADIQRIDLESLAPSGLRSALLDDLAQLHRRCFTSPPPWSAKDFAGTLAAPHSFLLEARAGKMLQGFLLASAVAGEAELLTLAVDPKIRRLGLGAKLVKAFLAHAQERAADSAFLEVSAENMSAIRLYERMGFSPSGRRKAYYILPEGGRVDAILMHAALPAAQP